ncbi:hypothetical protein E0H73_26915 [Kribbella pittospori]|uniref:Uncharacterized protein n=1 Tax=Kribbella pittospori TaxID=722689 RepID=A0A4R0KQ05_9ACTN|nr:hypothetical protein [Kribbella pittospori]TCC57985.1 hypothetical protein E0H73_26915 [Kribbella pittospori]
MISAEETIAGLQDALSLRRRVRSLVQLFGASAVVGLVGTLWLTEDGLPVRTHIGFAAVMIVGLLTIARAAQVLRRRGHLFARDRVIAGWIAVGSAAVLAIGLALAGRGLLGTPVVVLALLFLAITHHTKKRWEKR